MEKSIGIPVKIIQFVDAGMRDEDINRFKNVVTVRDLINNKEFDIFENQIKYDGNIINLPESSFENIDLNSAVMAYIN